VKPLPLKEERWEIAPAFDWAAEKHDVLVADETGEELLAGTFTHDEQGLRALCRALVRLKVAPVAIERPDGLLVERFVGFGGCRTSGRRPLRA
jgi:hypothetical protein